MIPHRPRSEAEAAATPISRPGLTELALAAGQAGTRRIAVVHVLPGLEHLVAGAPPAVGRRAIIGPPGPFEPHAELADAASGVGAEDIAGEADAGVREAAYGRRVTRAAVPGIVVLRIDGETTAGDQIVGHPDVMRVFEGVPYRNSAVRVGGHPVRVVLDEPEAGAFGLIAVLVAVGGRGGETVKVAG